MGQRRQAGFSEAEIASFQGLFDSYDKDGSGEIDAQELESFLEYAGMAPRTRDEQQQVLKKLDAARRAAENAGVADTSKRGSACVQFWELVQLLRMLQQQRDHEEEHHMAEVAKETRFSRKEVDEFREVFVSWRSSEHHSIYADDAQGSSAGLCPESIRRLIHSVGIKVMTSQQHDRLHKHIAMVADQDGALRFEGFLH